MTITVSGRKSDDRVEVVIVREIPQLRKTFTTTIRLRPVQAQELAATLMHGSTASAGYSHTITVD